MADRVGAVVDEGTNERPAASGLDELFVRHAPDALRLAFLLTGDADLAQDLAQEAFIKVAGRFGHLRDRGAFEAYLRRTVVNLAMSHHRRRRVERRYLAGVAAAGQAVSPGPDTGRRDELRAALAELPIRQRAAVVLRYYQDLPEAQVAESLGCSVPAARSLVARAMDVLRERIERGDDR